MDDSDPGAPVYARESGANQLWPQAKLAMMEHAEAAAVFGTGMAALHAVLNHGLIRLAVGLESADDLIADLDAALATAYGPGYS